MTFPKYRKNEDLINRSNFVFRCLFVFIWIGKNAHFRKLHFRPGEKFILFGSFLGVGENLLQIFRSSFRSLFVFFLRAEPFKKKSRPAGPKAQPAGRCSRPQQRCAPRAPGASRRLSRPSPSRVSPSPFLCFVFLFPIFFLSPTPSKSPTSPI